MRQIEDLIAPLQEALSADGATLHVIRVDGSSLLLRLDTTAAECAECIVSDEVIESVVLQRLRAGGAADTAPIERVLIEHVGEPAA